MQIKSLIATIQMKATVQNVPLVPFIETMNGVLTFYSFSNVSG